MFFYQIRKTSSEKVATNAQIAKVARSSSSNRRLENSLCSYKDQDHTWPVTVKDIIAEIKRECLYI